MSNAKIPAPGPGRPKDPAKRAAVLQAAQQLFLRNGYEGTSMDAIAAKDGLSKLTVLNPLHDKLPMYLHIIWIVREAFLPVLSRGIGPHCVICQTLERIGLSYFVLVNFPAYQVLRRLLVG